MRNLSEHQGNRVGRFSPIGYYPVWLMVIAASILVALWLLPTVLFAQDIFVTPTPTTGASFGGPTPTPVPDGLPRPSSPPDTPSTSGRRWRALIAVHASRCAVASTTSKRRLGEMRNERRNSTSVICRPGLQQRCATSSPRG